MTNDAYEQLADALDRLPNAFPRTPSKVEIAILKRIFSPEEALLASQLCGDMEPIDVIAKRVGLPTKEARSRLMKMARRGLVWFDKQAGKPRFRLAPFVVGIYEAQLCSSRRGLFGGWRGSGDYEATTCSTPCCPCTECGEVRMDPPL